MPHTHVTITRVPEHVAHAALTRSLCAGTIIGGGTVSNENYRKVGSSCIAERRGISLMKEPLALKGSQPAPCRIVECGFGAGDDGVHI